MRNWIDMNPGHFDAKLLPKTRKAPAGQTGLFLVADVAPVKAKTAARTEPEMEGQADLFTEDP